MSVFKVRIGNDEFAGTAKAGEEFHNYWADGEAKARDVFANFIYGLIYQHQCTVTYQLDTQEVYGTEDASHKKKLYYKVNGTGDEHEIDVRGEQDRPEKNKVDMIVPAYPVDPTAQYLQDALDALAQHSADPMQQKAYLLGLILLKRCR